MKHEETLLHIRLLLEAAGYCADDLTERLFDALIDMGSRQTATIVRAQAKALGLPFAGKPYRRNTP